MSIRNQTTKQVGEYLTAAEMGRRGIVATTFSGNMPDFDVLGLRPNSTRVLVQVKAMNQRTGSWILPAANTYLDIELNDGEQRICGRKTPSLPDLIWMFVVVAERTGEDEFYILSSQALYKLIHELYEAWLVKQHYQRPKINPPAIRPHDLRPFKDNWSLITGTDPTS